MNIQAVKFSYTTNTSFGASKKLKKGQKPPEPTPETRARKIQKQENLKRHLEHRNAEIAAAQLEREKAEKRNLEIRRIRFNEEFDNLSPEEQAEFIEFIDKKRIKYAATNRIKAEQQEKYMEEREKKRLGRIQESVDELLADLEEFRAKRDIRALLDVKSKWELKNNQRIIDLTLKNPDIDNFSALCCDIAPHENLINFVFNRKDNDGVPLVKMLPQEKYVILIRSLSEQPELKNLFISQRYIESYDNENEDFGADEPKEASDGILVY